jgi:5-methylcytosine-specific restriction endonuclease McrA
MKTPMPFRLCQSLLICLAITLALPVYARSSSGHSAHASSHHATSKAVQGVARDHHGKIKRSARAKDEFKHEQPCPSTGKSSGACPGYVIDHVNPLKRGGADAPSNMQWQTKEAAKEKDKWE